jgi:hypothetical protein
MKGAQNRHVGRQLNHQHRIYLRRNPLRGSLAGELEHLGTYRLGVNISFWKGNFAGQEHFSRVELMIARGR